MAAARVTLVAPGPTAAVRAGRFPLDEPLDDLGRSAASAIKLDRSYDVACCAPTVRARETAALLWLPADDEPALAPWDVGDWAGRAPTEVSGLVDWRADPAWAGHGGESLAELIERAGGWLLGLTERRTVAVADPAVIRAAVAAVLPGGHELFWAVDVAPLGIVDLRRSGSTWTLTGLH